MSISPLSRVLIVSYVKRLYVKRYGILKNCVSEISKPLHHFINLSTKTPAIPSNWKIAKISLLFKSGSSSLPEIYRQISILPVLSKILEKAVHKKLTRD